MPIADFPSVDFPTADDTIALKRQKGAAAAAAAAAAAQAAASAAATPASPPVPRVTAPTVAPAPTQVSAPPAATVGSVATAPAKAPSPLTVGSLVTAPAKTLLGTAAVPLASAVDAARGAIASVQGKQLVNPDAANEAAANLRNSGIQTIKDLGTNVAGAIPVGATVPAAPPVPKPRPAVAPAAPQSGTVAVPTGTLKDLAAPREPNGSFVGGSPEASVAEGNRAFVRNAQIERDANYAKQSAGIDATVANANRQRLRDQLEYKLHTTRDPSTQRLGPGQTRPRGSQAAYDNLVSTVAALGEPVSAKPTASVADVAKQQSDLAAADAEKKGDEIALQTGQLALQGEQRKAGVQGKIADLVNNANAPQSELTRLGSINSALNGRDPNADRFQGVEEVIGTDQLGSPIKVRSLYDTRSGQFVQRPNAPAAPPDAAIQKLKSNPQLAKDFDAKYGAGASAQHLKK